MTSVPPTNNDDPDETPQPADSPSDATSPVPPSPGRPGASSAADAEGTVSGAGDAAPAKTTGAAASAPSSSSGSDAGPTEVDEPGAAPDFGDGDLAGDSSAGDSSSEAASTAPSESANPAPGRSSHAAPRPTPGLTAESDGPATHRLPTQEEDDALRAERERRFGRVAGSPATAEPVSESESESAAPGTAPVTDEPPTSTLAPPPTPPVEEDPFADFDEGPTSRAAAHWWGILIAIVFGPVTWYLIADGGERVSYALNQNLEAINVLGLIELAGGLITLVILLLAARWSSVGSIIIGSIGTAIGAAFVVIPSLIADFLTSQSMLFDRLGQFGTNIFDHLTADGHSGRLLAYGIAFIFIGVISHGARRQGRREERRKTALGE